MRRCDAGVGDDALFVLGYTEHGPIMLRELDRGQRVSQFRIWQVGKRWLALWTHSKKVPGLNPPFCVEFACTSGSSGFLTQSKGLLLLG